jgi:DNA-binding helix-hairpin-helix protein with protein kinase domain
VVRVATNIARAFAQVHAAGNVIGDVNHGNALVGRDGTVVLIDCDSFQVRDGARIFTCDVGVPLFTPPELSGHGFRGLRRTANHDAFGLAVLLFHLLYIGRHPFAGKYSDGEMPIERAIAESRFVYGAGASRLGMTPPPGTLPLKAFGDGIAQLFERAFASPGDYARPAPAQWIDALQALESSLAACSTSSTHYSPKPPGGPDGSDPGCCWCALERHTGVRMFGAHPDTFDALGTAKLAPLWDAIMAVPRPEPVELEAVPLAPPGSEDMDDPLGAISRSVYSWLLLIIGVAIMAWQPGAATWLGILIFGGSLALRLGPWGRKKKKMRAARHVALMAQARIAASRGLMSPKKWKQWSKSRPISRALWKASYRVIRATREWNALASDKRFEKLLASLSRTKAKLLELPQERKERMNLLNAQAAQQQRYRYLDRIYVDKAGLPGVSRQDISMLAAFGIDSAAEVLHDYEKMRGLVSASTRMLLLDWARACERNFEFNPVRDADPEGMKEVDTVLLKEQDELLANLGSGLQELEQLAAEISAQRKGKERELYDARQAVAEAARHEQP